MRALVFGADGFVGRHLVAHLRQSGDSVVEGIGPRRLADGWRHPVDVREAEAVRHLVRDAAPDAIYHLAAVAYGPDAARDLPTAIEVTVEGTANVLEAIAASDRPPMLLVTGSSEIYGAPAVASIDESLPIRPVSLYGATKAAQELLAFTFGSLHGLPVVVTRSFNHIGPGQRDSFAVASFARQLREMGRGKAERVLRVGNLEPVRDFTDVRDVVRAYRLLVVGRHAGQPINVASGRGQSMREIVDRLIELSQLEVEVVTDPVRVRTGDPPRIVGDASRLHALTAWEAEIPLDVTLRDIWDDLGRPA